MAALEAKPLEARDVAAALWSAVRGNGKEVSVDARRGLCGGCPARSRGRGREREPCGRLLQHGGEPLSRLGPFFLQARDLGAKLLDLLA